MKSTPELLNEYDRLREHGVAVHEERRDSNGKKEQVARIFNELFVQLQAAFPASVSTIREQNKLNEFRKQWMLAFLENGITTMEQVNAGMRHARASESPFWPSPGQFIKWCKDSKMVLGVTIDDVMAEFHRYSKEKSLYPGGPERFPWRHPVMYWVVCDTRRAMYQRQLSEIEVEKHARRLLDDWAKKVASGQQIPDPVEETPPDLSGVERFLQSGFKDIYETLTREEKRTLWRSAIKEIRIDKENNVTGISFG